MTNKPGVTKADREAYTELFHVFPDEDARVMAGECDDYDEIQIIARHREQSTAALQAKNARLREVLNEICAMQAKFYGDGIGTHLALSSLAATARQALTKESQDD